jgi:hypothetical protein
MEPDHKSFPDFPLPKSDIEHEPKFVRNESQPG